MRTSFKYLLFLCLLFMNVFSSFSQQQKSVISLWGDQGNGTFINPILNADYSDPDVVRVDDNFYMVCSEFHFMGMPVLHSKDMVNWRIIGRIYDRLEFDPAYNTNERYAGGSWAPSIRFHDNKFWVYFCTPDEGLFMSTADKPEGPWEPLTQVVKVPKWEDPCPFWDDNGQAYLVRSKHGAGPIIVHKLSEDGKTLLDDGFTVYNGPVAEGPKFYKRNGYYYISIPEGGVGEGWQTILRSKNIYGPYEKRVVLETGSTRINGPHQGAMVNTPNGEWWFFHFQMVPALGRVVHLQPMKWENDWPLIGIDLDRNGIGEPVYVWKKPDILNTDSIFKPQTSDNFDSTELGLQWAWNHNPVDNAWSLKQNPGKLTLHALQAYDFLSSKNTLTQKLMGYKGEVNVVLDGEQMEDGQQAGLCVMAKAFALLGLKKENGQFYLYSEIEGSVHKEKLTSPKVYLKVILSTERNQNEFLYSINNSEFISIGRKFQIRFGHWKGPKVGLFSFNELRNGGSAIFDSFQYDFN